MSLTDFVTVPKADPEGFQTGRRPLTPDPRAILVDDYLDLAQAESDRPVAAHFGNAEPAVPKAVHDSHYGFPYGMGGNGPDPAVTVPGFVGCGDCVPNWVAHHTESMQLDEGQHPAPIPTMEIIAEYSSETGFDLSQTAADGSNPTDQGTDPNQTLKKWAAQGIFGHKIAAYGQVDMSKAASFERGMAEFGGLGVSLDLPDNIWDQVSNGQIWDVPASGPVGSAAPDPNEGHQVFVPSYDGHLVAIVSWGRVYLATYPWLATYAVQGNVVISQLLMNKAGVTPLGYNLSQLQADLSRA